MRNLIEDFGLKFLNIDLIDAGIFYSIYENHEYIGAIMYLEKEDTLNIIVSKEIATKYSNNIKRFFEKTHQIQPLKIMASCNLEKELTKGYMLKPIKGFNEKYIYVKNNR